MSTSLLGRHESPDDSWLVRSTNGKDITPDPFAYAGIYGVYTLSTYRSPLLRPSYVATFLMTCLGDLSDATSEQSYKPSDPYPDSLYVCNLRYTFPNFDIMTFHLELKKIAAAGWEMTFSDLAHDLEELWYALMWFDDKPGMVPNLEIGVQKYTKGVPGPKFQAAAGSLTFREGRIEGNVSVS